MIKLCFDKTLVKVNRYYCCRCSTGYMGQSLQCSYLGDVLYVVLDISVAINYVYWGGHIGPQASWNTGTEQKSLTQSS